jgi:proteasome accessory factor B
VRRLERLYALTEEIRRHEPAPVSAPWLAERFGVSRRTIERDLTSLRDAGVPVRSARGRAGGYVIDPGVTWTPVALNPSEVTALLLALAASPAIPYGYATPSAATKLRESLPAATRAEVERLCSRLRVIPTRSERADPAVLRTVEDAVRQSLVVRIDFTDRHGTRTRRFVEPAGFYGNQDGWSLVAWCRLRDAGRLFRLRNIHEAAITSERAPDRDFEATLGWVPGPHVMPET